jgi:hypothetical protein
MNRFRFRYLWLMLASCVLLVEAFGVAAQSAAATVRPDPTTIEVAAGALQTVTIVLENAADVYGIDVRASFDPAHIEVVDTNPARDGVQVAPGAFPKPDFVALNAADNSAGTVRYAVTQINPTLPATGSGTLFTFQVRGKSGGDSQLRIDLVEMSNRSGELLPVQTAGGAVRVTGSAAVQPTAIILPTPVSGGQSSATTVATTTAPTADPGRELLPPATASATAASSVGQSPATTVPAGPANTQPNQPIAPESPLSASNPDDTTADTAHINPTVTPEDNAPLMIENPAADPLALTQPETLPGETTVEMESLTDAAAAPAVIGAAAPVDEAASVGEEAATDNSLSLGLVAIAGAFILLVIAAVVFARRVQGS